MQRTSDLEVTIPAGAEDGMRLRLQGMGMAGQQGAPPGDLYLVVHVAEDGRFEREGPHLHTRLPIGFSIAALGGDVQVDTLDGKAEVKIPAGTQPGTTLRLRGKGLPEMRSGRRGDLLVTVTIDVPRKLNAEQKRLLREFEEAGKRKGFFT